MAQLSKHTTPDGVETRHMARLSKHTTRRLMAWKHAIWPTFLYSTSTHPGEGAIYRYLSRQGKIAGDIHETKSSGLSLS